MSSYQFGLVKQSAASPYWCGCLLVAFLTLFVAFLTLSVAGARADSCPQPSEEIVTDRPDVTNSSIVVPMGSFQSENGINFSSQNGGRTIDGTNSRWRLGIAPCLEVLVDLPTYFSNVKLPGNSGFSDVAPAVKWQISPVPGKVELSMTVGISLPTGQWTSPGVVLNRTCNSHGHGSCAMAGV